MTALGGLAVLNREHYLVFDSDHNVDGCQCGYPADDSDEGHGDSIASHLMEVAWGDGYKAGVADVPLHGRAAAWHEGHQRGLADADLQHAADNPYEQE